MWYGVFCTRSRVLILRCFNLHLCADHPGGKLSPPEEDDMVAIYLKQTKSDNDYTGQKQQQNVYSKQLLTPDHPLIVNSCHSLNIVVCCHLWSWTDKGRMWIQNLKRSPLTFSNQEYISIMGCVGALWRIANHVLQISPMSAADRHGEWFKVAGGPNSTHMENTSCTCCWQRWWILEDCQTPTHRGVYM